MKTAWTASQQSAIDLRNTNLLVSAAAGAGKTSVLVERLVRMLYTGELRIENILMVTFTNAAAGEMRARIYAALQKALETDGGEKRDLLRRQMNLLGAASISTIHAFCMEVVRQYSYKLELDSGFRVGDTTEMKLLREEMVDVLLETEYEQEQEDFMQLADVFSTPRSDENLRSLLIEIYEFLQNQPEPLGWLREKMTVFGENGTEDHLFQELLRERRKQGAMLAAGAVSYLQLALEECAGDPALDEKYHSTLQQEYDRAKTLYEAAGQGEGFREECAKISFGKLPNAPKDADKSVKERVQKLRDSAKKLLNEVARLESGDDEQQAQDMQAMQPVMGALQRLLVHFDEAYQAEKQERGLLDFYDLEHYALRLLQDAEIADSYRRRFQEIFIDEYQDSNRVQEEILTRIARPGHLFMVGDVKQSIYGFRSADPGLFRFHYQEYKQDATKGQVVDMQHNFRSTKNILATVNDLFGSIMRESTAEMDYDSSARLLWMESQETGQETEWLLLDKAGIREETEDSGEETDGILKELEAMNQAELEAEMLAGRIQGLMQETVLENGASRPVKYHDIVILLRSLVSYADPMAQVLAKHGIPVYTSQGEGYFDAVEIRIFLDLLRLLDNSLQDIPLLSVLHSPLGGFSLPELAEIRIAFPQMSYQQAMAQYAETAENALADRLQAFMRQCRLWQKDARQLRLTDFIWKLLRETGYYEYVQAMPGGRQRQANLRLLLDRAESFQSQPRQSLFRFLRYMEEVNRKAGAENSVAGLLSEKDDVVRIMSVHKSKGLEFPIVILANVGKHFNTQDTKKKLLLHKRLGVGIPYADFRKHTLRNTLGREMIAKVMKRENMAEEMRILYVACTRAKQRLLFSAVVQDLDSCLKKWKTGTNDYAVSSAACWADWLGGMLWQHPDGKILREWSEEGDAKAAGCWESRWKLSMQSRDDLFSSRQQESEAATRRQEAFEPQCGETEALPDEIRRLLEWQYPWKAAEEIPSKMTVTQLKQMSQQEREAAPEEVSLEEPAFIRQQRGEETKFSASERGTLTHQFLRQMDFFRAGSLEELRGQLAVLSERGYFTPEEVQAIYLKPVWRLANSELGERIRSSRHFFREIPFYLMLPAVEVFPEYQRLPAPPQEKIMVQGTIDLYFEEEDGLVLVDYKTDYAGDVEEAVLTLKERYAVQIQLYRRALKTITGKPVKLAGLYLLSYGKFVEIEE